MLNKKQIIGKTKVSISNSLQVFLINIIATRKHIRFKENEVNTNCIEVGIVTKQEEITSKM